MTEKTIRELVENKLIPQHAADALLKLIDKRIRYFVYFFDIPARGHFQAGSAFMATADFNVPSWKKMRERLVEQFAERNIVQNDIMISGFHEFANEQDYKDFCG